MGNADFPWTVSKGEFSYNSKSWSKLSPFIFIRHSRMQHYDSKFFSSLELVGLINFAKYLDQIQRNFDDDIDDDSLEEPGNDTGQLFESSELNTRWSSSLLPSVQPNLAPRIAPGPSSPTSTNPSPVRSSERSPRRTLPNGRRQELVWNPLTAETDTLSDISSKF
jgi:hypothetical protein